MRTFILISAVALTACATTSKRKIVDLSVPTPIAVQQANHQSDDAHKACDTPQMRSNILDNDPNNDTLSATVIRDGQRQFVELDCMAYFEARLKDAEMVTLSATPNMGNSLYARPDAMTVTGPSRSERQNHPSFRRTVSGHRVTEGETLSYIARKHCTSVDQLLYRNSLSQGASLTPGTILILPANSC